MNPPCIINIAYHNIVTVLNVGSVIYYLEPDFRLEYDYYIISIVTMNKVQFLHTKHLDTYIIKYSINYAEK